MLIRALIDLADPEDRARPRHLDAFMALADKFRGLRVVPAVGDVAPLLCAVALANWHELASRGLTLDLLLAPAQLHLTM